MHPRAIILAAGKSRRLGALTENTPKCLLSLGRTTILDLQLEQLRSCGIEDITIVTGFCDGMVRAHCGNSCRYILNPVFDSTNSIYSLWLALQEQRGGIIVLNSDVVVHPRILRNLVDSPHPDALTISFQGGMGQEEMKVQVREGRILDISKDMDPAAADGENVGLVKFSATGAERLFATAGALVRSGVVKAWAPRAFQEMCATHALYAVSTAGLPWIEIDFPEDLEHARSRIYPSLCGDR